MNIEPLGAFVEIIRPGDHRFEDTLRRFGIPISIDPNNNYRILFRGSRGTYHLDHCILGITPLGFIESRRIFNNGNLGFLRQNVPYRHYEHRPIQDGRKRRSRKNVRTKTSKRRSRKTSKRRSKRCSYK